MELLRPLIGWTLGIILVGGCLFLLYVILRFSIISPFLTRGSKNRLRKPNANGIGNLCGFEPSADLFHFYRTAPFIENTEFYLVDTSNNPAVSWQIGSFIPMSVRDLRESQKVMRVAGIPIAIDMDKGTYFVDSSGAVLLKSPNVHAGQIVVAPSISKLSGFKLHSPPIEA
ncbi:hypothetical protein [Microcoleus sp. SVA1B1]|uniref:hypothetical protein n=1 Tax=Microcoleus sp. SVA1B1 TaxID=3055422 RepID=UPI002FD6E0B9